MTDDRLKRDRIDRVLHAAPAETIQRRTIRQGGQEFGHVYTLPDGTEFHGITSKLKVINKAALIDWAAKQERTLVTTASVELYERIRNGMRTETIQEWLGRADYLMQLEQEIGKERAHQRIKQQEGDIGKQAHKLIEYQLRKALRQKVGKEPQVSDKAMLAAMAFEEWARDVNLKPLHMEQMVYSRRLKTAGTTDLVAYVRGELAVVDLKRTKAVYAEMFLQVVFYQLALAHMGHGRARKGIIIRVPKDLDDPVFSNGSHLAIEPVDVPPVEDLWPTLRAMLTLYDWWYAEDQKSKARWYAQRDAERARTKEKKAS